MVIFLFHTICSQGGVKRCEINVKNSWQSPFIVAGSSNLNVEQYSFSEQKWTLADPISSNGTGLWYYSTVTYEGLLYIFGKWIIYALKDKILGHSAI